MKLHQLTEGISDVVYHSTSVEFAGNIVDSNRFRLSPTFTRDKERNTGSSKKYFMSVARSKLSGFIIDSWYDGVALMVLDGRKLGNRYKAAPVQYFSRDEMLQYPQMHEMEDRIYSDIPYIDNATDYISSIHILITNRINRDYRNAITRIKRAGIPCYLYDDASAAKALRIDRAKPIASFEFDKKSSGLKSAEIDPFRTAEVKQHLRRHRDATGVDSGMPLGMTKWVEMMVRPVSQWHMMDSGKRWWIERGTQNLPSLSSRISSDFDTASKSPSIVKTIADIMRRNNLKTPDDIAQFIVDRWKPVVDGAAGEIRTHGV